MTGGRGAVVLLALGLALRLAGLTAWGTHDVEIQKAWASRAATHGVADIYGPPDDVVREAARAGRPFPRTEFEWQGANYFVDYPPGSVLLLWAEGRLYRWRSPEMRNRPAFNAAVNLGALFGALAIAWLLAQSDRLHGWRRSLAFWLNPAVLLAAPFLGYQDTTFGAFALGGLITVARGRWALAAALTTASILIKPQGALLLPFFAAALASRGGWRATFASVGTALATAVVILAPWWTAGHLLSAIDGCLRPLSQPTLAPLGLNLWWLAGYVMTWVQEGAWPLARIVTVEDFQAWSGIPAPLVARAAVLAGAAALAVWAARRRAREDTLALGVVVLVHAYALFGTSVHENHSFLAVMAAPLLLGRRRDAGRIVIAVSSFLAVSLLLMDGLGRRVTTLRQMEELRLAAGLDLSVLVALAHIGLVVWLVGRLRVRPVEETAA